MDVLTHKLDNVDDISAPSTSSSHRDIYKKRGGLNQEERRRRLLETQKKRRHELFDLNRDLEFDENEESESFTEDMEVGQIEKIQRKTRGGIRKMLMFSEWMMEIPEDLLHNWYFIPTPVGKRCVLIARKGVTKMFTKWGKFLRKFQCALPAGSKGEYKYGPTILDCIWSEENSICHILDVIFWKGQGFNECEAEFRFYWLKTKFEETPELQNFTSKNKPQLQVLPRFPYSPSDLAHEVGVNSMWASNSSSLDGIIFYHKNGHYYSGEISPLVEWLKPFMLPEILGIEVLDVFLQEQPENYVCLKKYVAEEAVKKKLHHKWKNNMEVDEESDVLEKDMNVNIEQEELESMACAESHNTSAF